MTKIEFIKFLFFGDVSSEDMDSELISNLINSFGFNGAIRYIAVSEKMRISGEATSVNDGANSFSFSNKLSGLDDIIKKAEQHSFTDPESEEGDTPVYWAMELQGEKDEGYFGDDK